MIIKIINFIITKLEGKLSNKLGNYGIPQTLDNKLRLYRNILNEIDKYNYNVNNISTFRHYRWKNFKVDKLEEIE